MKYILESIDIDNDHRFVIKNNKLYSLGYTTPRYIINESDEIEELEPYKHVKDNWYVISEINTDGKSILFRNAKALAYYLNKYDYRPSSFFEAGKILKEEHKERYMK